MLDVRKKMERTTEVHLVLGYLSALYEDPEDLLVIIGKLLIGSSTPDQIINQIHEELREVNRSWASIEGASMTLIEQETQNYITRGKLLSTLVTNSDNYGQT